MYDKLDVKQALKVFQIITEKGTKNADAYSLEGIEASSDIDGYTIILANDYVTLSIGFHSRHHLTSTNKREEQLFFEKIQKISKLK